MNDRLIVLGTGNANVTHCYNTCFAIDTADGLLLCDAGGGNGIMRQLEKKNIGWERIHHLILTHAHTDHLLGSLWAIRGAAESGKHKAHDKRQQRNYHGNYPYYIFPDIESAVHKITVVSCVNEILISCFQTTITKQRGSARG